MNTKRTLTRTALSIAIGLGFSVAQAQASGSQQRQHVQHHAQSGARTVYQGGQRVNPPRHLQGRDMTPRVLTPGGAQADPRTMVRRPIPVRGTDDAKAGGMEQTHPGADAVRTKYGTTHDTNTPRREPGEQQAVQHQTGQPQSTLGSAHAIANCEHKVPLENGWIIKERLGNNACLWEIPAEVRARYQRQGQQGTQVQQSQGTGSQQVVRGSLLQRTQGGR